MSGRRLTAADLDREAIDAARLRAPSDKLRDGLQLFDRTCAVMVAGIENDHPGADPSETLRILRERLGLARRLESGGYAAVTSETIVDTFLRRSTRRAAAHAAVPKISRPKNQDC